MHSQFSSVEEKKNAQKRLKSLEGKAGFYTSEHFSTFLPLFGKKTL